MAAQLAVDLDLVLWLVARATGMAAFVALSIAILSGIALRTAVLDVLSTNRGLRILHEFTTALWLPLGAIHVVTIVMDRTARIGFVDVVLPFQTDYGALAIGLGTISFDIFAVVAVTSWLRRGMNQTLWRWIHRTSYPAFAALFLHALWSGTDFGSPVVSAVAWATIFGLAVLSAARILWGRLPA
jgi:sulfoxide reductase heme-binding subunit YedZ